MKWMIASDIHGSASCCEKMIQRYEAEGADRLILLGDLLYHGPRNDLPEEYRPKAAAEMLNGMKEQILCVRGNCDCEVDQMMMDFPILAEYALLDLGKAMVFVTHGHKYNGEAPPPLKAGDILLSGHTHIPDCTERNGIFCLNPGSVSIPKGNSERGYMTLENGLFLWKTLDGTEIRRHEAFH